MDVERYAARLARGMLAGPWDPAALPDRARACLPQEGRWVRALALRIGRALPHRPTRAVLTAFLVLDRGFSRVVRRRLLQGGDLGVRSPVFPVDLLPLGGHAALARHLHLLPGELDAFADLRGTTVDAPSEALRHYRWRWVGARLLEEPKARLKQVQRRLLRDLLDRVPTHEAAHGFVRGRSAQTAAAAHVGADVVVCLDLERFFPTVTGPRVRGVFEALGYEADLARVLAGLCTTTACREAIASRPRPSEAPLERALRAAYRRPHLPQGAPTSPALSNLVAYRLDARLTGLAAAFGGAYTRYADDLTFSGGPELRRRTRVLVGAVREIARDEGFRLREDKTRVQGRGGRQRVLGLVVNEQVTVSRREVDRLEAILTRCRHLGPSAVRVDGVDDLRAHLEGRVAWVRSVDPGRARRLVARCEEIDWSR